MFPRRLCATYKVPDRGLSWKYQDFPCNECDELGVVESLDGDGHSGTITCPTCEGRGYVTMQVPV